MFFFYTCIYFSVAVECPAVRAPLNGRILGSGNAFGTLLEFECTDGFMLYGSVERRCQSNKTWSGEIVTCDRKIKILYS